MKSKFEILLNNADRTERARLFASSKTESSKWLPSSELGLILNNNTARIEIAIRLEKLSNKMVIMVHHARKVRADSQDMEQ